MLNRSNAQILILILALITLSACGPDVGVFPPDPDGEDSGEDVEMTGPQKTESAEDGSASVHYHYEMKLPDLKYKIEPVIPLMIVEAAPGSFEVTGTGQTRVQLRMVTSQQAHRCNVNCDVILLFTAVGEIHLDHAIKCFKAAGYGGPWTAEYEGPEAEGGVGYEKCYKWLCENA